ncbi:MAG: hypothetical protein FWC50_14465 [Planctomycetaceae bacterium]|nr:hypothetical protein [Planctomycetaceae bacterium]
MEHQSLFQEVEETYTPRKVACFAPKRILLAKGWNASETGQQLVQKICRLYPEVDVEDCSETSHNRVTVQGENALGQHQAGKQTLVFSEHKSSVRFSDEEGNTCPNYWHFSLYGFCPYGCTYCYLAGTPSVRFSSTVKIFLNVDEVTAKIRSIADAANEPTSFYHGKLQDGLALDPLTGYSRRLVPFFAALPTARQVILTKSTDVENLPGLEHGGHTVLSWTINLPDLVATYEPNTPAMPERIQAMKRCAEAGYPVRAVLMPLIPVEDWIDRYAAFLQHIVEQVPLKRLTIGAICSYPAATELMNRKLGHNNPITVNMERRKTADGRTRYAAALREQAYRHLVQTVRKSAPDLEIGLCLETHEMFETLEMQDSLGRCNCVL